MTFPATSSPITVTTMPLSTATCRIEFSFFSSGYLDVSVPRVPSAWLWIHHAVTEVSSARFPHSDTRGSLDICSSPRLFAAYHVFLRLLVPRHPPCALFSLTFAVSIYLHRKLPHTACSLLCSVTTVERLSLSFVFVFWKFGLMSLHLTFLKRLMLLVFQYAVFKVHYGTFLLV